MPQSEGIKEVIINTGNWRNLKLPLGLDLNGTTKSDANSESLFAEFVIYSQLPKNNLEPLLSQVLICWSHQCARLQNHISQLPCG